jgi:hypothetical protein
MSEVVILAAKGDQIVVDLCSDMVIGQVVEVDPTRAKARAAQIGMG